MLFISNLKKKEKGFTLIELMVAVTLFTVILTLAFTSLYAILNANRKTKTLKMVINNLNMAMESMSREIRVGYDYTCNRQDPLIGGQNCVNPSNLFSFKTKDNSNAYFKYNPISKGIDRKIAGKDLNPISLISDDIIVENLSFVVVGTTAGDTTQPRVLLIIKGLVNAGKESSTFNIQTTISQRKLAP